MTVIYKERPSESPFVQTIWQATAISNGADIVTADSNWDMIIVRRRNKIELTMWGAMTQARSIDHLAGADSLGIRFKLGTTMPRFQINALLNEGIALPGATSRSFWLNGSAWEFPNYENVERFVRRLVCEGLLIHDPLVDAVLQGQPKAASPRSIQRHFQQTTGLTFKAIQQIERAHRAAAFLQQGWTILDTAHELGYFDQSHLTNALRRFTGKTPTQILRATR